MRARAKNSGKGEDCCEGEARPKNICRREDFGRTLLSDTIEVTLKWIEPFRLVFSLVLWFSAKWEDLRNKHGFFRLTFGLLKD